MAWAQEMKNLATDIRTSHRDRTARLCEIKTETEAIKRAAHDLLREADAFMKRTKTELKEAARNLRDFLAKSEGVRKEDFNALMQEIRARMKEIRTRVRDIKGETKDFLAKSEEKRIADFKDVIKDIRGDLDVIKRSVVDTLKTAKGLILSYTAERKEATRYWAGIRGREGMEEVRVAPKMGRKRGRPRKK